VLILDPAIVGGTGMARDAPLRTRVFLRLMSYIQVIAVLLWPNGLRRTPAKVGRDTIYACFDAQTLGEHPNALYLDGTRVGRSGEETYDEEKWGRLWESGLKSVGLGEEDAGLGE
jgi:hypothetical protein